MNSEDLVFDNKVASNDACVNHVNNYVNNSSEAEMSLSPTIIIPLINDNDGLFRVRTLLDPGSGTNWIVAKILKHVAHTVKGSETLEVVTFSGKIKKRFPLVEIYYKNNDNVKCGLMCYVYDVFTRHITAKGMVNHIITKSKVKHDLFSI